MDASAWWEDWQTWVTVGSAGVTLAAAVITIWAALITKRADTNQKTSARRLETATSRVRAASDDLVRTSRTERLLQLNEVVGNALSDLHEALEADDPMVPGRPLSAGMLATHADAVATTLAVAGPNYFPETRTFSIALTGAMLDMGDEDLREATKEQLRDLLASGKLAHKELGLGDQGGAFLRGEDLPEDSPDAMSPAKRPNPGSGE